MPKQLFLTPIQNIAMNLVFAVMGEYRFNRTQQEYAAIAAKLRPLKILVHEVNKRLELIHRQSVESGIPLPLLCRLKQATSDISMKNILAKFPTRQCGKPWKFSACAHDGAKGLSPSNSYLVIPCRLFWNGSRSNRMILMGC